MLRNGSGFFDAFASPKKLELFDGTRIYLVLIVSVISFASTSLKAEETATVDSNASHLMVYMPERIPDALLGDPIFLPLAIANMMEYPLMGTTMIGLDADIVIELKSGESCVACCCDSSMSNGTARKFQLHTVETFVVMLNTWSESFTAATAATKQCKIKAKFGVFLHAISAQGNINSGINYLPSEANCTIDFNGSAFKDDVYFAILNEARFSNEKSSVQVEPPYYEPSGLALCPLVSPLSWFLEKQGLLPIDYTSNKLPGAIVSEYVRANVKKSSKISRVFEYGECMESIVKTPSQEAWKNALPNLSQFVVSCTLVPTVHSDCLSPRHSGLSSLFPAH